MASGIRDRLDEYAPPEAVELGVVFAAVFAISVWASLVAKGYVEAAGSFHSPNTHLSFVIAALVPQALGIWLAALAYRRYRGFDTDLSLPTPDARTAAAIVAPAALVALVGAVGAVVGVHVSEISQTMYAPDAPIAPFLTVSVLPSVFSGVGHCLLVVGVIHETIRQRVAVGPEHAVGLTAVVVAFQRFVPITFSDLNSLFTMSFDPVQAVLTLAAVLTAIGFGASVGLVYRAVVTDDREEAVAIRYAPAYAFGLFGVFAVASEFGDVLDVVHNAMYVVAFVAAAYGYERERSLWVPVLTLVLFCAAIPVVAFVEATLGIAPVP